MLRALVYLIASVLIISILKAVLGAVGQLFSELFGSPADAGKSTAGSGPQTRRPAVPISEALQRDPVCGTFIAPSTATTLTVKGQTLYFCSPECRDKYKS